MMRNSNMLLFLCLLSSVVDKTTAFVPRAQLTSFQQHSSRPVLVTIAKSGLYSSTTTNTIDTTAEDVDIDPIAAKYKLVETALSLKEENGIFVIDKQAKKDLTEAVEDLEAAAVEPPSYNADRFLGNWTLICTTPTSRPGVDTSILPEPLKAVRNRILDNANKYLVVEQRIRCSSSTGESSNNDDADDNESEEGSSSVVDRIDHVLQYQPPAKLQELLDNLPEALSDVNINPLHVSKSKLVLVHKASVDTAAQPFVTSLSLQSIVLNVAGTSTFLEPAGKDIAGINIPSLGDFMNGGTFETTYMDDDVRISKGKQGFVDQLRVFIRTGSPLLTTESSSSSSTTTEGSLDTLQEDVKELSKEEEEEGTEGGTEEDIDNDDDDDNDEI